MSEPKQSIWKRSRDWGPPVFPFLKRLWLAACKASAYLTLRRVVFMTACMVTLLALVYTVENWRGKRAWSQYREEQEAKGVSFDFNSIVPPHVPDGKNFAFTPLLKPLYEFNPPSVKPRHKDTNALERIPHFFPSPYEAGLDLPPLGAWRYGYEPALGLWQKAIFASTNLQHGAEMGEPADDVLYALKRFDAQLEELHQASKSRPWTRYAIRYDDQVKTAIIFPHLTRVKEISKILALRASAYLEKGEADKAFADVNLILFMAEPLNSEPALISHLVRNTCFEYGLKVMWWGMTNHRWRREHLEYWQKRMDSYDFVRDTHQALEGERLFVSSTIAFLGRYPHVTPNAGPIFSDWADPRMDTSIAGWEDLLWQLVPRGWFYLEQLNFNQAFDRYLLDPAAKEKTTVDVKKVLDANREFNKFLGGRTRNKHILEHTAMVKSFMPALTLFFQKGVRAQSTVDLALIAIALERYYLRYQDYPESLNALVPDFAPALPLDILVKAPFKYERQSKDAFRLWSLGWNLKDDGGVIVRNGQKPAATIKLEEGDWTWPQVSRSY